MPQHKQVFHTSKKYFSRIFFFFSWDQLLSKCSVPWTRMAGDPWHKKGGSYGSNITYILQFRLSQIFSKISFLSTLELKHTPKSSKIALFQVFFLYFQPRPLPTTCPSRPLPTTCSRPLPATSSSTSSSRSSWTQEILNTVASWKSLLLRVSKSYSFTKIRLNFSDTFIEISRVRFLFQIRAKFHWGNIERGKDWCPKPIY